MDLVVVYLVILVSNTARICVPDQIFDFLDSLHFSNNFESFIFNQFSYFRSSPHL